MRILQIPCNYVAMNIPQATYEQFVGGLLIGGEQYHYAAYVHNKGTVVCVPDRLIFDKNDTSRSLKFGVDMDLKVGDTIWVNASAVTQALGDKVDANKENPVCNTYIENEDGSLTVFVWYDEIMFAQRDGEYFTLNGWMFIEALSEEEYKGNVIIPDTSKKGYSKQKAKVLIAGKKVNEFPDDKMIEHFYIQNGDIVYLPKYFDITVQNSLTSVFPEYKDKKIFMVHQYRIPMTEKFMDYAKEQIKQYEYDKSN
jgi:co-chaperonin GroES (HSP10)